MMVNFILRWHFFQAGLNSIEMGTRSHKVTDTGAQEIACNCIKTGVWCTLNVKMITGFVFWAEISNSNRFDRQVLQLFSIQLMDKEKLWPFPTEFCEFKYHQTLCADLEPKDKLLFMATCSPNVIPCSFFLLGYLNSNTHIEILRENVQLALCYISRKQLQYMSQNLLNIVWRIYPRQ
jgi:hypothetical protein